MTSRSDEFSPHRARPLTLLVLLIVAGGIALANLSSEPVPFQGGIVPGTFDATRQYHVSGQPYARSGLLDPPFGTASYGWPLVWHWWGAWEGFDEQIPDLDSFLGGTPMVGA